MSKIKYIAVSSRQGTDRNGTDKAPQILMQYCKIDECHRIDVEVDDIVNTSLRTKHIVLNTLHNGYVPIVVGGDHSIALGSIAGALEHDDNVGVIWFDAHGDINTEETSPSGNVHGMPVAALMGLCKSSINNVAEVRLKPENIFWVGVRSIDPGEREILKKLGIETQLYTTASVQIKGMDNVMREVGERMSQLGITRVHLSFDVDGMDPSVVWATGTRVDNGLVLTDFESFVEGLKYVPTLCSMDFVEYNPLLEDEGQSTLKWCKYALEKLRTKL